MSIKRRIALTAAIGAAVLALTASPALAWHVTDADASRDCDSVTLTVQVPDEEWFTGTATLAFRGASASTSNPGPLSVTVPLDSGEPGGTASGTVTWSDSPGETENVSAPYPVVADCEQPVPTTTVPPTTTKPPAETSTTNQTRPQPDRIEVDKAKPEDKGFTTKTVPGKTKGFTG